MKYWWLAGVLVLLSAVGPANAQVSIGIGVPSIDIGIHLPALPTLQVIPGSPVYYAPNVAGNFFFYDGMYWVYQDDNWYSSSWYNGPWALVEPDIVPPFILQVPVRYYRRPPAYFHGWAATAPPRWADHWGPAWAQRHAGWDHVDRAHMPRPAPVPTYQRQYAGQRYPTVERQPDLHAQNYKYQPHEPVVRQHYEQHAAPAQHQAGHEPERGEEHRR